MFSIVTFIHTCKNKYVVYVDDSNDIHSRVIMLEIWIKIGNILRTRTWEATFVAAESLEMHTSGLGWDKYTQ